MTVVLCLVGGFLLAGMATVDYGRSAPTFDPWDEFPQNYDYGSVWLYIVSSLALFIVAGILSKSK